MIFSMAKKVMQAELSRLQDQSRQNLHDLQVQLTQQAQNELQ